MKVYKYLSPDGVAMLANRTLRFSSPLGLNDPFECLPTTSLIDDPRWVALLMDRIASEAINGSSPAVRKIDKLRARLRQQSNMEVSSLMPMMRDGIRGMVDGFMDDFRSKYRVASLSQVPPNSPRSFLLWSHYTHGHKGLVIGLDLEHPFLKTDQFPNQGTVKYSRHRTPWEYAPGRLGGEVDFSRQFFTKSVHWIYEREYRLVLPVGAEGKECVEAYEDVKIPEATITDVFIGVKASPETVALIDNCISSKEYAHVQIHRARMDHDKFGILVSQVSVGGL